MTATDPGFRCAVESAGRPDDLAGTASQVRAFLLVEEPGPWGVDALTDSRLEVGAALKQAAAAAGVRPLLARRHGRSDVAAGRRVFAAWAHPHQPWLETAVVERDDDLLSLDLAALGRGDSPGLMPSDAPVIAVCTHGRHDACCAERGRPASAALAQAHPEESWQVSHIGGDRFAGNLVVLPHGLYYGRIDPTSALTVAGAHLAGHVDLDHLRGRSGWAMPVQAAEIAVRRRLGETRLDAVRLLRRRRDADAGLTRVELEVGGRSWAVEVRTTTGPEQARLTCRAGRDNPLPHHEIRTVETLS
ncbi:sucrase ferredoxin [Nocardioides aestuarii]|uniref:Sucrase ferredoxin n=1 Tax=Nocardioides aestuarii TaxID=252231 RepID=A0ABW4TMD5_9ACTN